MAERPGKESSGDDAREPGNTQAAEWRGTVPVLAAVIRRDGRWLLARRPAHKRHGGLWEFPGGKMLPGESWLETVRRELREELAIETLSVGEPLFEVRDPGSEFVIVFVEVEAQGEPKALEHQELRWVKPADVIGLELAPADRRFVDETLSRFERSPDTGQ